MEFMILAACLPLVLACIWLHHITKKYRKTIREYHEIVQGAADFESGIIYSADWIREVSFQMQQDSAFQDVAPLILSLEEGLLAAANVRR